MISQAPGFSRVARAFATGADPDFVASLRPNIKNVAHPQRWNNTVLPTPKKSANRIAQGGLLSVSPAIATALPGLRIFKGPRLLVPRGIYHNQAF